MLVRWLGRGPGPPRLPHADTDGLSVLREFKKLDADSLVILLTSFVSVETAVDAMKLGAFHFANTPFDVDDVAALVARALETTRLRRDVKQLRENEARPYTLRAIVGESRDELMGRGRGRRRSRAST